MRRWKIFITTFLMLAVLMFAGCGKNEGTPGQTEPEPEVIEEENIENLGADAEATIPQDELDNWTVIAEDDTEKLKEYGIIPDDEDTGSGGDVVEDGKYSSKEDVAAYIYEFEHLPANYITKEEAQKLGWVSSEGNLWDVAPGMSIGGDRYRNYDGLLPEEEGREYYECDIDFDGSYRNEKRIVYSNDGLIFYTGDHYETFEQLY